MPHAVSDHRALSPGKTVGVCDMLSCPIRDTLPASSRNTASLSVRTGLAVIFAVSLSLWGAVATLALHLF